MALETSRKIDKITEEISWNLLNDKKKSLEMNYEDFNKYFSILSENESIISKMKIKLILEKKNLKLIKK